MNFLVIDLKKARFRKRCPHRVQSKRVSIIVCLSVGKATNGATAGIVLATKRTRIITLAISGTGGCTLFSMVEFVVPRADDPRNRESNARIWYAYPESHFTDCISESRNDSEANFWNPLSYDLFLVYDRYNCVLCH